MSKPYSESCDQNKAPILSVLQPLLETAANVLEVGSGTGQHAVYFAQKLPHLHWQTSDCHEYLNGINHWIDDAKLPNVIRPFELDVSASNWPVLEIEAVFTANTVHIMHQHDVESLFSGVGDLLSEGGVFIIYGPFKYDGKYTSESNERFDSWLKNSDPSSGIKHIENLIALAERSGMKLTADHEMPANNRILHFTKFS